MGKTWALCPDADHFEPVPDDERAAWCVLAKPPKKFDYRAPTTYEVQETFTAWPREYVLPNIMWRGVLYVTDTDKNGRINTVLRIGESMVLFFAWLKARHDARGALQ